MKKTLYKTLSYATEGLKYLFLAVAIPIIVPTMAVMEILDTLGAYLKSKSEEK